jgi:hypothetical protein
MAAGEFQTYRAKELAEIPTVGTYRLKVIGSEGVESKWLSITSTELERIIKALEPEDYAQALDGAPSV